jgi:protein-disulfide isomerase/uncharacterized membrane protein
VSFFKREATDGEAPSPATRPSSDPPPPPPAGSAAPRTLAAWRLAAAALLCLVNTAVSGLLLLQHHGEGAAVAAVGQLCGEGADSGCETVARSPYSRIKGIPLAAVGFFFYGSLTVLLVLALLAGPEARAAAAALALLALAAALVVDMVLLGVQAVAIRDFCRLCLLTYLVGGLAFAALFPARRDGAVVGEALRRPVGTLAVGVLGAELGLAARERARLATILGPAPAAAGAPSVAGAPPATPGPPGSEIARYQEEARVASEQARRLQELLDDPNKLEQYFAERAAREFEQAAVHPLKLDGVAVKGPPSAPIKVVEFADFLCPTCRNIAGAFDNYLPTTGGRVAVYFKNYPLEKECNPNLQQTIHPGACVLAMGGICANEQGKFWQYHDRVFAGALGSPGVADAQRLAGEAGLDAAAFESCLKSSRPRNVLLSELAEAKAGGVVGTPTLFINGKRLPRLNDFTQAVDREAARLRLPPPSGARPGP